MKRILNFSAGPATLPLPVLEEASKGVLEIAGSGMSILEVSHRGKQYEAIHAETKERLLRIMGLDATTHQVLFLGGGASTQFLMLPMNFLAKGDTADYIHTGEWSSKAIKEAKSFGTVHLAGSSESDKFASIPKNITLSEKPKYLHYTTNNTIEGTQYIQIPDSKGAPLIADSSSDFLCRDMDYSKFSLIYAGAQKNMGPAGVTLVVARKSFLETAYPTAPTMLAYKTHATNDSLYNTPPAFNIYVVGLVLKWIENEGGLKGIGKKNERKAQMIYEALDQFPECYDVVVKNPEDRSWMNITFRIREAAREEEFLKKSKEQGMDGLKGHRSVGGMRASVYNAFPLEGAEKFAEFLTTFAKR